MNRNAELLSLLTAHGVDPGKPFGGLPSITQMDVAGMMAKCSACEVALLRAKYCGESSHDAWAHWFIFLMKQGWTDAERGQINSFAHFTLGVCLRGSCSKCRGVGAVAIEPKVLVCQRCDGSGNEPVSDRKLARQLGIGNKLDTEWRGRLKWALDQLQSVEMTALYKLV